MNALFPRDIFGLSARQPPSNMQAEQSLIGAILCNNKAFDRVADFLEAEHFFDPVHQRIYQRISERILSGEIADAVTLKNDFEASGVLDDVGGTAYLASLLTAMVGIIQAAEYGRAIYDCWIRRRLIELGSNVVDSAFNAQPGMDAVKQIEMAERALGDLVAGDGRRSRTLSVGEAIIEAMAESEAIARGERQAGYRSRLQPFDEALGGLWPKTMVLLAGVPGAGKTALALQVAYMIARNLRNDALAAGRTPEEAMRIPGVLFISLEMSAAELGLRMVAWLAGVPMAVIREGRADWVHVRNLAAAQREAATVPLHIIDCVGLSVGLLGAKVRMEARRRPAVVVMVDHLLVLDNDDPRARDGGLSPGMVMKATKDLKRLTGALNVCMVVLTHLSRDHLRRVNPRPNMSDLKLGGEGDADAIMLLYRPEDAMDRTPPKRTPKEGAERYKQRLDEHENDLAAVKNLVELIVPKNRQGPKGVTRARIDGATTSFSSWDEP